MMSEDLTAGARDSLTGVAFLGSVVGMMANATAQETDGVPAWLREACVLIRDPVHHLSAYTEGIIFSSRQYRSAVNAKIHKTIPRIATPIPNPTVG